jgi:hypothetical protein
VSRASDERSTEPVELKVEKDVMNQPYEGMHSMGSEVPPGAGPSSPSAGATPYATAGTPPPVAGWDPRIVQSRGRKSPLLAALLSFLMAGLGQIYIGYYQRGFLHAAIFVGFIGALTTVRNGMEPMFGVGLGFFYLYNIIDAARRATLYNQAIAGVQQVPLPEDFKLPTGRSSLFGGLIVVGIGLILLMNTRFDFDMRWLEDWWPAIIVLIGANMVYKATRKA